MDVKPSTYFAGTSGTTYNDDYSTFKIFKNGRLDFQFVTVEPSALFKEL